MTFTAIQRKATLSVTVQGTTIGHVKSASWSGSFGQPYNEAKVVVTQLPGGWDHNQSLVITAGNGITHTTRFVGLSRSPIYNLDGTITIQGVSQLAKAYEYQNSEDPRTVGGLEIYDLVYGGTGSTFSATEKQVITAVLNKVGLSGIYSAGNIGETGVVYGAQQFPDDPFNGDAFMWVAADRPGKVFERTPGVGESALDYISKWDKVSAVHPGPFQPSIVFGGNSPGAVTSAVGFYRTYETLAGSIHRSVIGGRPRGTPTIATPFTEGVDIRVGEITRGYPVGNRFVAIGYDWGRSWGPENFAMQSSNTYMGTRGFTCPPTSSPFMEKSCEVMYGAGQGMSCERVAYASEPDWNRIIVSGTISTGRDDYVSHGATILVQGPGGAPGRLGTGENVWVQAVRGSVSMQGFVQEFEILGGGVPDNYLPAVAQ